MWLRIMSLDCTKASGLDGISAFMLKSVAHSISPSLTELFNLSIAQGCFPQCWKLSSIVPIPKSKNHTECSAYRHISLLSIVSKLLEKHILHLSCHLLESNRLSNHQWGFQAGKGTVAALLTVTNEWLNTLDSGGEICAVFFYLKVFDSVRHIPLIEKLVVCGLCDYLFRWITIYLTNRKQRVVVEGVESGVIDVLSGVPQGSVLGPLPDFH